ncbi:hypothetical protein J7E50_02410 [Pedobacter sp. ISL-68]|uniref:hypothetical protein n=1 Tax=unclassified Pedobacter TaxID=2628915 RepID=UPI001BEA9B66|nr:MULTISPECIES: hypothetical protein [unclassified Pedobacter]MBT2560074.1 hypothetical protein [Pedobacter sp. ISL-64]MBT2589053.1 hypothetical protein [Pedobacter sp. ISL-68]
MENIAWYVYVLFSATVVLSAWLFIKATGYSKTGIIMIIVWTIIQSGLGLSGFYSNTDSLTSRFPLLVIPPVLFLGSRFFTVSGKAFIDGLDLKTLTIFHIIRIPVEVTLLFLFLGNAIPEAMTFEGRNFDILSGLSAPVIYYFAFVKKSLGKTAMIIWNVICIVLLLSVVTSAVLSLPERYNQFGFEQPNIGVGFFPFLLLPALLVPLALFSGAAAIRQLVLNKNFTFKNQNHEN